MDWNPAHIVKHVADGVSNATETITDSAITTGKALNKDLGQTGNDLHQTIAQVSRDLAQTHYASAAKNAVSGLADVYEDAKTSGDDSLTMFPRLVLSDAHKSQATDPAGAANNVVHSNVFLHDGELSDRFFRGTANSNVSNSASAWDMGQVLESDTSVGDMRRFDEDLQTLEKYRGGESLADIAFNLAGGKNTNLGFDAGWKPVIGANSDQYYDDNSWIGLALLDADKIKPNKKYVDQAKKIMELELMGAQGTEGFPRPGGEFWCREKDYRNTVSSAGAAQLALLLYEKTNQENPQEAEKYLQFVEKQFSWVDENLKAKNDLYMDGVDRDGKIEPAQYSYNQGLMLGDATLLYKITGDSKYLNEAKRIADNSVELFGAGNNEFSKQLVFFNAVFFKNLMLLDTTLRTTSGHETNPAYRQTLANYAKQIKDEIDPKTGVIKVGDNGERQNALLDQAAAVQILALDEANSINK